MLIRMNEIAPQSRTTLLYLRNRIKERMIPKGDFLVKDGDPGNILICIKQGCLKAFIIYEGVKLPDQFMEEGYVLFLPNMPVRGNIQATEDTTIYYIDPSDIDYLSFTRSFNGFSLILLDGQRREHLNYNYIRKNKTEPERVDWLLERQPGLINRVPVMDLVMYLQVDISTLQKKLPPGKIGLN